MSITRRFILVASLLLTACATPPNTAVIKFESAPSAAAILSPGGSFLGVTPFEINLPLTREWIVADAVRLGNATAIWHSGAKAELSLDFRLDGRTSGTVTKKFHRPGTADGLLSDIKFAEDRERKSNADANEGWGVLADIVRENNRQRASLPAIKDPLASPTVGRPSVECVSQKVWPNQVQTTCK